MSTATLPWAFTRERLRDLFSLKRPGVTWRHDVDFSLDCARQMAEFEAEHGVRSTYFILPRSPEYDAFDERAREAIAAILDSGHRLGTHVDLGLPRDATVSDAELQIACKRDWHLLWSHYPVSRQVSFHQPPHAVLSRRIPGYDSVHDPAFDGQYVGDSRGVFRENPEEKIARQRYVSVSLHPIWWFGEAHLVDQLRAQEADKP